MILSVAQPQPQNGIQAHPPSPAAIREQLGKILLSSGFRRSRRLRVFLSYVVEETLTGRHDQNQLKEYAVAEAVFERKDFDPKDYTVVRTTAKRLRDGLEEYYATQGANDAVIIDVPIGAYVPRFTNKAFSAPPVSSRPRWGGAMVAAALGLAAAIWAIWPVDQAAQIRPPRQRRIFARSTSEGGSFRRIALPRLTRELVMTPDGRKLYALAKDGHSLFVLRMGGLHLEREIALPQPARGIPFLSHDGRRIYLCSTQPGIMVVDTGSDTVRPRIISTSVPVFDLAVTSDERRIFLGLGEHGLQRLRLDTGEVHVMTSLRWVGHLAIDRQGKQLYVAWEGGGPGGTPGHDVVEIFDLKTEQPVHRIRGLPMVGNRLTFAPGDEVLLIDSRDACAAHTSKRYDQQSCPPGGPSHPFYLWRPGDRSLFGTFALPGFSGGAEFFPRTTRVYLSGASPAIWDWGRQRTLERVTLPWETVRGVISPGEDQAVLELAREPGLVAFEAEDPACMAPEAGQVTFYAGDGTFDDGRGGGQLRPTGTVTFTAGRKGQAFRLDGRSSLFAQSGTSWCPFCTEAITETFFVKFDVGSGDMTVLNALEEEIPGRRIRKQGSHLVFESVRFGRVIERIDGQRAVPAGQWVHVAVVTEGGHQSFYVDGALEGRRLVSGRVSGIGSVWLGSSLRGWIDEIALYNRALEGTEIRQMAKRCGAEDRENWGTP